MEIAVIVAAWTLVPMGDAETVLHQRRY